MFGIIKSKIRISCFHIFLVNFSIAGTECEGEVIEEDFAAAISVCFMNRVTSTFLTSFCEFYA